MNDPLGKEDAKTLADAPPLVSSSPSGTRPAERNAPRASRIRQKAEDDARWVREQLEKAPPLTAKVLANLDMTIEDARSRMASKNPRSGKRRARGSR